MGSGRGVVMGPYIYTTRRLSCIPRSIAGEVSPLPLSVVSDTHVALLLRTASWLLSHRRCAKPRLLAADISLSLSRSLSLFVLLGGLGDYGFLHQSCTAIALTPSSVLDALTGRHYPAQRSLHTSASIGLGRTVEALANEMAGHFSL
jgi:hypothetical protein